MATKLNELTPILVRNSIAGVNTFLRGKPGIGKTVTIMAFAEKMREKVPGFQLWTFYAPTMSPMDIQASAPDYDKGTLRLFNNEALPNAYTNPDAKGVVFFGELPNTDPATAKLLQKYINGEDMSGTLRKPDGVVVIADGNRIEDKSGVQQQGRAFLNRFEQLEVYTDAQDNLNYAIKQGWHPYVLTFFRDNPAAIDNYDDVFQTSSSAANKSPNRDDSRLAEEGKLGVWANMRAWERISKKEFAAEELGSPLTLGELLGNLGSGVATAYNTHKTMLLSLTSFEDIMADPAGAPIPEAIDEQYALSMLVAMRCTIEQLGQVKTFAQRMTLELQAALLRHISVRKGMNLRESPVYIQWLSDPQLVSLLTGR